MATEENQRHPCLLGSISNLGTVYHLQNKLKEAEAMHSEALEGRRAVLGELHLHTLDSMYNLANVYKDQVRWQRIHL